MGGGGVFDKEVPERLQESGRETNRSAQVKEQKQVDHFPDCALV